MLCCGLLAARLTMLEKRKAMICDDSVLAALVKILTSHQNQAVCGPQQALHLFVRSDHVVQAGDLVVTS